MALTCGLVPEPAGIASEVFCAEPLLVGLRPGHRLASRDLVALSELAHEVLGTVPAGLFPARVLTQRQALEAAGIAPPAIELADTDLAAIRWADQPGIDWILLIPSLAAAHTQTVIRPVAPSQLVPFTMQWNPSRAHTTAVSRFVHCALAADLPPGWHTQPDHLHHTEPNEDRDDPHPGPGTRLGPRRLTATASTPSRSGREFWLTARCCGRWRVRCPAARVRRCGSPARGSALGRQKTCRPECRGSRGRCRRLA